MRRIAAVMAVAALGGAALPTMASAAGAALGSASAHLRKDGRVELFVHVRHPRTARLKGHVHVDVVDAKGRTIAAGGDRETVRSGRDLRYRVILARRTSARVAARMRHDGRLLLRVIHSGTATRGHVTRHTDALATAMAATVLDTDISVETQSGIDTAPGLIIFGSTPWAGCTATPNLPTPVLGTMAPARFTEHVVCQNASGATGTLDLSLNMATTYGLQSATVLGGSLGGTTVTGGELTGSVALNWFVGGYGLEVTLWGAVSTSG